MSTDLRLLAALGKTPNDRISFKCVEDLPNCNEVTANDFWRWGSSYTGMLGTYLWCGRTDLDRPDGLNGRPRAATLILFYVGHGHHIDGGFAVATPYNSEGEPHYYTWAACAHQFLRSNIGNCLNRYTCVHCKKYYDIDSSD